MATQIHNDGLRVWSGSRDSEGYRTWKVQFLIRGDIGDGPATVMQTPGLPLPGSPYLLRNDVDVWAWFRPDMQIQAHQPREGDPDRFWTVEMTASNKPQDPNRERCQNQQIEDPLLEPPKISGGSIRYTEEATEDRFGTAIQTSSFEQIRGPQVEFDANRDTITIEINVPDLDLPLLSSLRDTVNDQPLWGFEPRCVKFSSYTWDRHFYGLCSVYYTRKLVFETNVNTFDKDILDEGSKVLNGHWDTTTGNWTLDQVGGADPDPNNPTHFIKAKDRQGENMRVVLDGEGKPIDVNVTGAIIDATDTGPIIITSATNHGLATGDTVAIKDVEGLTSANGDWTVTVINATTFSLDDSDGTGDGPYTNGTGYWEKVTGGPGKIHVEKYDESNLLLLGIPIVL